MHRPLARPRRVESPKRWIAIRGLAALLAAAAATPSALAQAHVDNPFVDATWYVSPDYASEVASSAASEPDAAVAAKMRQVASYPTAVWLDRIAAIQGADGRMGLAQHLDAALAQRQGAAPITVVLVVYDLPNRDCAALASNGELTVAGGGLERYETEFIDPIAAILSDPKYKDIRVAAVIEPDSLPNLVTNSGMPACAEAQSSGAYAQGVQYAIRKLHAIENVYLYLDIAHSAWLGWPSNLDAAVTLYTQVVQGAGGLDTVDGFITDTANATPLQEPFLTATQTVGGQEVKFARFYQANPYVDESDYAAGLYAAFVGAGWPTSIGFLIDTSRSGWGGPDRPAGPSASDVLDTFVDASRIDRRAHRGLWCNVEGEGLGEPPQASPPGLTGAHVDALVWVKPPGESDGTNDASLTTHPDPNCDPAHVTSYGVLTGALPGAPVAGAWFPAQFAMLVKNAYPPVATDGTAPDYRAPAGGTTAPTSGSGAGDAGSTPSGGATSGVAGSAASGGCASSGPMDLGAGGVLLLLGLAARRRRPRGHQP
jgi:cellulose 1,4-beta-cellobiosidase